jgi:catechol 2,3-dioxygenase-like lactoylglutathione lyase family enzyme
MARSLLYIGPSTQKEHPMNDPTQPATRGVHHVGLTVPDLHETRTFFVDSLGYEQVGEIPDYPAAFLSDGSVMITLWQAAEPERARPFDRRSGIGLHHLALAVEDEAALKALHERIARVDGVDVEFAPESLGDGPTQHMMCAIPGGIRIEFIAPAA